MRFPDTADSTREDLSALPRHSLQPELLLPPEVFPRGLRTHIAVNHKSKEAADAVVMTTRSKKKKKLAKRSRQHPDTLAFPWAAGCCPAASPRRFFPKPSWVQMSKARLVVSPATWGGKGRDPSKAAPWCWVGSWRDAAIPPRSSHRRPNSCSSGEG